MENDIELWECGTCGSTGRCPHCQIETNEKDDYNLEYYNRTGEEIYQGTYSR